MSKLKKIAFPCLALICFFSCKKEKKEKTYSISGTLLFSNSLPTPVANYALQLYQQGSNGIGVPSNYPSSRAEAVTDNDGKYKLNFKMGEGYFLYIPASNSFPVSLSTSYNNNQSLPKMMIRNFPLTGGLTNPLYLCKKIDTVIMQLSCNSAVSPSDTFAIYASNLTGRFKRFKTGFTARANRILNIDTVFNGTFGTFDYSNFKYDADFAISSSQINIPNIDYHGAFALFDEKRVTLIYYGQ